MRLRGPSREEVWRELCRQINGEYVPGGLWRGAAVKAHIGPWTIVLDIHVVSTGETSTTYTRLRAPYVNRDGFRFTLSRRSIFTGLGKLLGMPDIVIGDSLFDNTYVVQSNHPERALALFSDDRLRELLLTERALRFKAVDDEGMFGPHFGDDVDELAFVVTGEIRDVERLKVLFEIFAETLHQLCLIGSAYEVDPDLPFTHPPEDSLLRGSAPSLDSSAMLRPAAESSTEHVSELPRSLSQKKV